VVERDREDLVRTARRFDGLTAPLPRAQPSITWTSNQPGAPAPPPTPAVATSPQLATRADEAQMHYQRAIDAQRAGDGAKYGEEIKALGQALDRMKQR
jgi:uncharacterized membrane protein (UPF0182 family)